jgi:transposase-like protein
VTDHERETRRRRKAEIAIRSLTEHGNPKRAAADLGIAESTLRKWVAEYLELNGYETVVQAAYWLDRDTMSA